MLFGEEYKLVTLYYRRLFANHHRSDMQQLTVGEDVFKLLCFSLAGCTEMPLFWDGKGNKLLKTGTGLDWMSQQYDVKPPPSAGEL